ncbi:TPA: replication factor C large subunit [Candidatus Woesearchaeota archaeon]|nr:replication factor C large subunit [Candidatus Woesearchaeota archaeon]
MQNTKQDSLPWTKKYIPKSLKDIEGQDSAVVALKNFVLNFKGKDKSGKTVTKAKKRALIVYGAPGCGKTSSVYALANDFNLELLEINASDFRNESQINAVLGHSSAQRSLFFKEKLLLVDELDGVAGREDRGGLTAIQDLIETTNYPIIITSNAPYDQKFSTIRKKCELVEFQELQYLTVYNVLKKICDNEKIKYDEMTLKGLARRAGGDLRGAITDLQLLSTTGEIDKESLEELGGRRQLESMLQALVKVFKTTDPKIALSAFENVDEDMEKIFLWIDENLPREYDKPDDLARAYDVLSRADVMYGRISRWQHWRFLSYVSELLTAGIAVSKKEKYAKFVQYQPTQRILKIWMANQKYLKRKAIAQKIAGATHSSVKEVVKDMDYYKIMFKKNKEMGSKLAEYFELDDEEADWLRK